MANSPYGFVILPISDQGAFRKGYISIIDSEPVNLKSSLLLISPGQFHQYIEAKNIAGWIFHLRQKS